MRIMCKENKGAGCRISVGDSAFLKEFSMGQQWGGGGPVEMHKYANCNAAQIVVHSIAMQRRHGSFVAWTDYIRYLRGMHLTKELLSALYTVFTSF